MGIKTYPILIRRATSGDIESILRIAHQYPKELGFVRKVSLEDSLSRNSLLAAEYEGTLAGFVNYRSRRDGWSVIYEIAVHKDFTKRGIGSFLLNAVPFPIRLKCPIDNASNSFYANEGFTLESMENGIKRQLNVWYKKRAVILCKGSSPSIPEVIYKTGMLYGTRHTEKPLLQPFMVDIQWEKYDWQDYLTKLKAWKPVFVMAPDFMNLEQLPDLLTKIQELRDLGILKIAVCPKFIGAVQYIPKDCIIGISIPSTMAGFLPPIEELVGKKVHLLGGSPHNQIKYIREGTNFTVVSTDINMHSKAASKGTVFDGESIKWKYNDTTKQYNYQERILLSSQNIEERLYDV